MVLAWPPERSCPIGVGTRARIADRRPGAEAASEVRRVDGALAEHGDHVGRGECAEPESFLVECVNAIDEVPVPFALGIEVVTEAAIDEDVHDVSERDEDLELECVDEQRKDVMAANALEAVLRAIPVLVLELEAVELSVVAVSLREFFPELLERTERFGPALVPFCGRSCRSRGSSRWSPVLRRALQTLARARPGDGEPGSPGCPGRSIQVSSR